MERPLCCAISWRAAWLRLLLAIPRGMPLETEEKASRFTVATDEHCWLNLHIDMVYGPFFPEPTGKENRMTAMPPHSGTTSRPHC
jgi:hypothetical protein